MAIFHCQIKPLSRSSGRSAIAAAAYRAGDKLIDELTGQLHDYSRKSGVVLSELITPYGGSISRNTLWNTAEAAEKRKDARTARELVIALPSELNAEQRTELARTFAVELSSRYNVAVDLAIHAPNKAGDQRNHHAHLLCTTRQLSWGKDGQAVLGDKADIELSDTKRRSLGLGRVSDEITAVRRLWEGLANGALLKAGQQARIDSRSLKAQGIERLPTQHLGVSASAIERRTGEKSRKRLDWEKDVIEQRISAKSAATLAKRQQEAESAIERLSSDLEAAKVEQRRAEERQALIARVRAANPERKRLTDAVLNGHRYDDERDDTVRRDIAKTEREREQPALKLFILEDIANRPSAEENRALSEANDKLKRAEQRYRQASQEYAEWLAWKREHPILSRTGLYLDTSKIKEAEQDLQQRQAIQQQRTAEHQAAIKAARAEVSDKDSRLSLLHALQEERAEIRQALEASEGQPEWEQAQQKKREEERQAGRLVAHRFVNLANRRYHDRKGESANEWALLPQNLRDLVNHYNRQQTDEGCAEVRERIVERPEVARGIKEALDKVDSQLLRQRQAQSKSRGWSR